LPAGLVEADRLPQPIFTPTTKAPVGSTTSSSRSPTWSRKRVRRPREELRRITFDVYLRGAELAAKQGIIIADTRSRLDGDQTVNSSWPTR